MKATSLYRIASVLFVLFAAGHTIGFFLLRPPTPEGLAVLEGMNKVRFQVGGGVYTYGQFYTGFGLFASLYLVFSAFLAYHLGGVAKNSPGAIGALGWVFCAVQIVSLVLSWMYFLLPPVILSGLTALSLGSAAWQVSAATRRVR